MKRFYRVLFFVLVLGFLTEVMMLGFVIYQESRAMDPDKSDVILVLGAQIRGDQPAPFLRARLDKAMELYHAGYGEAILVSGGQGDDETISEAQAMQAYLISQQIPEEAIIMEDRSTSTRENMVFSKEIMDREGYRSAVIVTNDFHVYRGVREARRIGLQASGAAAPTAPGEQQWYSRMRETLAILYYWVFG